MLAGKKSGTYTATEITDPAERERAWDLALDMYAGYGDYEGRAGDRRFRWSTWSARPAELSTVVISSTGAVELVVSVGAARVDSNHCSMNSWRLPRRPPVRERLGRGRGWRTRRVRGGCRRSPMCWRRGWAEDGSAERDQWCLDNWDAVAAEVAAAHDVSLGVASHQLMLAMALRERLPRVAEVFAAGRIGLRLVIDDRVPHRADRRPAGPREGRHRAGRRGRPVGPVVGGQDRAGHRLLGGPL